MSRRNRAFELALAAAFASGLLHAPPGLAKEESQFSAQERPVYAPSIQDALNKLHEKMTKELNAVPKVGRSKETAQEFTDKERSVAQWAQDRDLLEKENARLSKEVADAHYNLGVFLQGANKADDALREYYRCLQLRPDDAEAYFNAAILLDTVKNDREKALDYYKKYLALRPKDNDVLMIRHRIEELSMENKVWGDPHATGVKEKLGR